MHLLHITEREALALIARITNHTPVGTTLGNIRAVSRDGVLAYDQYGIEARWCLHAEEDYAYRVVAVDGATFEITQYRDGAQLSRGLTPNHD